MAVYAEVGLGAEPDGFSVRLKATCELGCSAASRRRRGCQSPIKNAVPVFCRVTKKLSLFFQLGSASAA